jgi:hypothetical protein
MRFVFAALLLEVAATRGCRRLEMDLPATHDQKKPFSPRGAANCMVLTPRGHGATEKCGQCANLDKNTSRRR